MSRPLLDQRSGPLGHGRSAKVACPERRGTTNVTADTPRLRANDYVPWSWLATDILNFTSIKLNNLHTNTPYAVES